ncbi:MAG: MarR family transcriptional regulator [Bacteroidota bacterium]
MDPTDAFVSALRHLGGLFTQIAAQRGAHHATLSKQDLLALGVLGLHGDARMGELSERLGLSQSATTPVVDRLEDAGLVRRERSAEDRRVWQVGLTEAGQQAVEAENETYRVLAEAMLAPLSPADRRTLVRLLDAMGDAIVPASG